MNRTLVSRSLVLALSLTFSVSVLGGCAFLKKKKDAGSEDDSVTNAPTVTVGGTGAKNEKDVLRYANETAIADELGVIGKDGTKVKTFPGTGADISTLSKGVVVTKKAKFFSTGLLVTYDDPATTDGTKLMGWITPESIAAPGTTPVPTSTQVFTARPAVDAGPKDAGADAGKDAGADAGKVDAGGTAVVDAGGAVARPLGLIVVDPLGAKCPAGFVLVAPKCRRSCSTDNDCPISASCTGPKKTCAVK